MASVYQRVWRRGRAKRVSWGYTLQVPCSGGGPCQHPSKKRPGEPSHPDGMRQERCFNTKWETKEDAEKALAKRLLGLEEEAKTRREERARGLTFGQAVERYLQAKARKRSLAFDALYLGQLKTAFGADTQLTDITADRISGWKAERLGAINPKTTQPYAAASINRPLAALRHLLRLAHEEWGILPEVPKIRLEKEPEGRIRWLEPDEEARLLEACKASRNSELVALVTLALETGMRRGEMLGLTWNLVDLSRGVIRLELTKSGKRREVPMRQAVYDILSAWPGPRKGQVFKTRSLRTAFEQAVTRAGLEDFNFHDCRHHFASWFVMRGGRLEALQKLLGHKSLSMTLRYAHLAPDYPRGEMAKTERQPGAVQPTVSTWSAHEADRVRGPEAGVTASA